jgi:hypothetical protein
MPEKATRELLVSTDRYKKAVLKPRYLPNEPAEPLVAPIPYSNIALRVGWLRCGDDGSTKKGAGHASQPVHPPAGVIPPDPHRQRGLRIPGN